MLASRSVPCGHALTHCPHRAHAAVKRSSSSAPGGRGAQALRLCSGKALSPKAQNAAPPIAPAAPSRKARRETGRNVEVPPFFEDALMCLVGGFLDENSRFFIVRFQRNRVGAVDHDGVGADFFIKKCEPNAASRHDVAALRFDNRSARAVAALHVSEIAALEAALFCVAGVHVKQCSGCCAMQFRDASCHGAGMPVLEYSACAKPEIVAAVGLFYGSSVGAEKDFGCARLASGGFFRDAVLIARRNFLHEAALTGEEMEQCLAYGAEVVRQCHAEGSNVLSFGEMGIGNTSPSSVWMHLFTGIPLEQCLGAGSGLDSAGIRHKYEVLNKAVAHYSGGRSPWDILRYFGGLEMVMAVGAMLQSAELEMIILVDGFIMTNCMLAASQLYPEVLDYAIFGHQGDEAGHRLLLDWMHVRPLLNLGLRLGEGTGAVCAYPIVDAAVRMMNEMDSFSHANITKYF